MWTCAFVGMLAIVFVLIVLGVVRHVMKSAKSDPIASVFEPRSSSAESPQYFFNPAQQFAGMPHDRASAEYWEQFANGTRALALIYKAGKRIKVGICRVEGTEENDDASFGLYVTFMKRVSDPDMGPTVDLDDGEFVELEDVLWMQEFPEGSLDALQIDAKVFSGAMKQLKEVALQFKSPPGSV